MDKLTNYINIVSKATRQAQQDAAFVNLLNQEIEEFMEDIDEQQLEEENKNA